MDKETARFILNLFWLSHGGDCASCFGEMVRPFIERFPQFESLVNEICENKGFNPMCWKEE